MTSVVNDLMHGDEGYIDNGNLKNSLMLKELNLQVYTDEVPHSALEMKYYQLSSW